MIKINITTNEIVELFKVAGDAVEEIKLEENAGSLRLSKPEKFEVDLGNIALNDAKVRIKEVEINVNHITLREGELDIEGGVG